MTQRGRPPPTKWKIDWGAFSFVLALTLAILAGVQAFSTFNSDIVRDMGRIERDVAILKLQIDDLREAERERRRRERQ